MEEDTYESVPLVDTQFKQIDGSSVTGSSVPNSSVPVPLVEPPFEQKDNLSVQVPVMEPQCEQIVGSPQKAESPPIVLKRSSRIRKKPDRLNL